VRSDSLKVYYPYKNLLNTHPIFYRRYQFPPLKYSNINGAVLAHWLNAPESSSPNLPFVIEPNDHPLAVTGLSEPAEVLDSLDRAQDLYAGNNCKKILVEGEGQLELFKRYFSDSVLEKIEIVRLGSIAKPVDFENKFLSINRPVFLCLASDYKRKSVDLVLKAWLESNAKLSCSLLLACPNVPPEIADRVMLNGVRIISVAPLSEIEKHALYRQAHVVIASLHVDGGANIIEAFENGLPVITMRSQRSFVTNLNGWEINVPLYFYDQGYGQYWRTWADFWSVLNQAKEVGEFDQTIQDFVKIFDFIAFNPEKLIIMGRHSHEDALGKFSLTVRNHKLNEIYINSVNK
jgi:glycosyltransferase involved in cell wall biosynthesis